MRWGFREPFADEPLRSLEFSADTTLVMTWWCWWWWGVKNRDVIRFMEAETSRLKVLFSMRRLNLLSGSAGFASSVSGADAGLHLWTFAKRRLMPGGRRSSPGSSLTHTLEVISWGFDTDADELRSKESRLRRAQRGRLNRMSCCVFPLGLGVRWGGGDQGCQHGVSPQDCLDLFPCHEIRTEKKEKCWVGEKELWVNQSMELSVEVWVLRSLQPPRLHQPACNSDGTWQVEFPLVVQRKAQKRSTCAPETYRPFLGRPWASSDSTHFISIITQWLWYLLVLLEF